MYDLLPVHIKEGESSVLT